MKQEKIIKHVAVIIVTFIVVSSIWLYLFIPQHRGNFTITNAKCYGKSADITVTNLADTEKYFEFEILTPSDYGSVELGPRESAEINVFTGPYIMGMTYYAFDDNEGNAMFWCESEADNELTPLKGFMNIPFMILFDLFMKMIYLA